MNELRRRMMASDKGSLLGIWAYYSDGSIRDYANADSNAIGVAVITKNCSFVIDKVVNTTGYIYGGVNKTIPNVVATNDVNAAKADYNGDSNTTNLISALQNYTDSKGTRGCPPAEACRTRFGGLGYLGSAGEWQEVYENRTEVNAMLSKIGGTTLSLDVDDSTTRYWTSTQGEGNQVWYVRGGSGLNNGWRDWSRIVRAFCPLSISE